MFKFSLQILLSVEWFIWGQVLQISEAKNDLGYLDYNMKLSQLVPSLERH